MCHTGLTENQNRLLYLVSLYTHKAESHDDKDEWIRKPALLVLIYEGVVANVLDYDYAPASELIENRRIYLNISQEGKSDVEFLREEELLNGLQIATKGADSASKRNLNFLLKRELSRPPRRRRGRMRVSRGASVSRLGPNSPKIQE